MKSIVLLLTSFLMTGATFSQDTIYYCQKGGKKLVSDRPCDEHGAKQTKKVYAEDLYPISSGGGLSPSARVRVQQIDARLAKKNVRHKWPSRQQSSRLGRELEQKERICAELYRQKENIISRQRVHNTERFNEKHRKVNDQIYKNGC